MHASEQAFVDHANNMQTTCKKARATRRGHSRHRLLSQHRSFELASATFAHVFCLGMVWLGHRRRKRWQAEG